MQKVTTITPKFQVHIPVAIREKVGLKKHGAALIRAEKSRIIIEPIEDEFLSLGGSFQSKRVKPAETIRNFIDYSRGE